VPLRLVPRDHAHVGAVLEPLREEGTREMRGDHARVVVVAQVPQVQRPGDPVGLEVGRVVLGAAGGRHAHRDLRADAVHAVELERRGRAAAGEREGQRAGEPEGARVGEQQVLEECEAPAQLGPPVERRELPGPLLEQVEQDIGRADHGLAEGLVDDVDLGVDLAVDGEGIAHPPPQCRRSA